MFTNLLGVLAINGNVMTKKELEWFKKVEETKKETEGKKRTLDPFLGWIEK